MAKDEICACGHWFEEHYVGSVDPKQMFCSTCEVAVADGGLIGEPCRDFQRDPEQNTPESIADRGGEPQAVHRRRARAARLR